MLQICKTSQYEMYLMINNAIFLSQKEPAGYAAPFSSATRLVVFVSLLASLGLNFVVRHNLMF